MDSYWTVLYLDTLASSLSMFHQTDTRDAPNLQTRRSQSGRCRWGCSHNQVGPSQWLPHEEGSLAAYSYGLQQKWERKNKFKPEERWKKKEKESTQDQCCKINAVKMAFTVSLAAHTSLPCTHLKALEVKYELATGGNQQLAPLVGSTAFLSEDAVYTCFQTLPLVSKYRHVICWWLLSHKHFVSD